MFFLYFVIFGIIFDAGLIFDTFSLRNVTSLLRALAILSLILKNKLSKILLYSFFNWMLRLHNQRLKFNSIPLGYFSDLL